MDHFELVSKYAPTGDQPQAIEELVKGFKEYFPSNAVEYFVSYYDRKFCDTIYSACLNVIYNI